MCVCVCMCVHVCVCMCVHVCVCVCVFIVGLLSCYDFLFAMYIINSLYEGNDVLMRTKPKTGETQLFCDFGRKMFSDSF